MKKFILMFVMLLGSVATIQAQSFDFSCTAADAAADLATDNSLPFDPDQTPLFTADEDTSLDAAGFNQGRQLHNGGTDEFIDRNHYAVNIQLTPDVIRDSGTLPGQTGAVYIDVEDQFSNQFRVTTFNIDGQGMQFNVFSEALEYAEGLVVLLRSRSFVLDDDDNGFANAEDMMAEELFDINTEANVPTYSRTIIVDADGHTTQADIYVFNGQFRANVDSEGRMDFDTFQEAMDFIASFIYTAN